MWVWVAKNKDGMVEIQDESNVILLTKEAASDVANALTEILARG